MKKVWWKEAVVYQIYPASFCDSNGDGVGDIRGIINKLDYLKRLGIDVIWLSPVYQSPNADNGYDISDYCEIMQKYGTMQDFDELLLETHKRNIKLIMDLVVNHTSDEHAWFLESRSGKDNPYHDYYIWRKGKGENPPNNWGSWFGGSAWKYEERVGEYYLHIFSEKQPDLNWENEAVRNQIYQMMTWWLDKGIDGFRMDVISLISKVQEFPDGACQNGQYGDLTPYCAHGPRVHEYIKEMNQKVLSHYDIMTVGEAACVTLEEAKKYSGSERGELDSVFQFDHVSLTENQYGKWTDKKVDLVELKKVFLKWENGLQDIGWNSLFWSNHDQPRAVSRFGNDQKYRELSAKMLATCLHMMQGTPYIYQGEELGMTNAYFNTIHDYRDLETLNAYQELTESKKISTEDMLSYLQCMSRDNARTPMQWEDSYQAGFTEGTPWISVNANYKDINAREEMGRLDSVFCYYQKLIQLRHELEIIVYGEFEMLLLEHKQIFAYKRKLKNERFLVMCNFSDQDVKHPFLISSYKKVIGNYETLPKQTLRPYEAIVLEYKSECK